jgi:hypothetical protein
VKDWDSRLHFAEALRDRYLIERELRRSGAVLVLVARGSQMHPRVASWLLIPNSRWRG